MGALKRFLLIFFCVSTIVGVGYLVLIWLNIEAINPSLQWIATQFWSMTVEIVLLSVTALGTLTILCWALFSPSKSSRLLLEDGEGSIAISKEAIMSTARCTVERHQGLKAKDVRLKITGKRHPKMRLRIKVDPGNNTGLVSLGEELTNMVRSSVETLASYPLHTVRITFINPERVSSKALTSPHENMSFQEESESTKQLRVTAK